MATSSSNFRGNSPKSDDSEKQGGNSRITKAILSTFKGIRDRFTDKDLKCFEKARETEEAYEKIDRGTMLVPIDKIVGSVGRYQDFDDKFRIKNRVPSERYQRVKKAMVDGVPLPPVKLYQIKDEYFALDGNHRIAAAKELRRSYINACIVELLPSKNTFENILYREKVAFRDQSGLSAIPELSEVGQYGNLLDQIEKHRFFLSQEKKEDVSFQTAALDWRNTIYLPLKRIIEKGGLIKHFPGRTLDDLYAYVSYYQWERSSLHRYGIGVDKLIPKNMEAFRSKMAELKEREYPEMKRKITVFVLMNVEGKKEHKIIDKIFALDEVREIHSVHGAFDFIIKVVLTRDLLASDSEIISNFVHNQIRLFDGVTSTQTLIPGFSRMKEPEIGE